MDTSVERARALYLRAGAHRELGSLAAARDDLQESIRARPDGAVGARALLREIEDEIKPVPDAAPDPMRVSHKSICGTITLLYA